MLSEKDIKIIQKELTKYDDNRESVLKLVREAIRLTSKTITFIHRSKYKTAEQFIKKAEKILKKVESLVEGGPWFPAHKNLQIAHQELAEAKLLYKYATEAELSSLKEIEMNVIPYLLGLLDFIGELRRMVLTMLLKGEIQKAEKTLKIMEGIFDDLSILDHTALLPSFRNKMDAARRIVEATRGDVVTEIRRWNLENAINNLKKKMLA